MKRFSLKLSLLGFAVVSFTQVYAAANTIPTVTSGFSVSLTGLYLQPNASNLTYAVYTHPLPITTPNWSQITIKPGYSGAFDLGLQYLFADTANKASLDWLHVSTSDTDSFAASGANSSVAPTYYFGPLAQALIGTSANSKAKFNVDNVNLTGGHLINLGSNVQVETFAGLQYAYLKQDITSTYLGADGNGAPYSITTYNTSRFSGIGPRVGANATYFVTSRFGISAKVGGSLLVGSMKTDTNFNSFGAGNRTAAATTLADQSQNRVVPEFDSKLEANYTVPMKNSDSSITLAAGYMFSVYFNGIEQVVPTSLVPGAFNGGTIAIETAAQDLSNLSLNGPYATLIWKFA